ncbi:FRG domain-containing protein [Leclercia adecarboxylata]|uniref:FRG domain-containing protein n=1 Tax=Leclercia adecarboxylata TaxID=83655 RepID=UPI00102E4A77|nr:FRG domain-containing protein [Leclercia adecarboxylata]MCE9977855.1 FRG domain-containing protein [Leclercia adecarboxylata]QBF86634.1 FRG domain-containing protein [Leclercia adecarboxylata]
MNIQSAGVVEGISNFVTAVLTYRKFLGSSIAFRGQKGEWDPWPSLFRKDRKPAYMNEDKLVREIVSAHPYEFNDDKTMFDRLVRMQHHDLPTRLLDVSINPLVALWFATEQNLDDSGNETDGMVILYIIPEARAKFFDSDAVSCIANLANLKFGQKEQVLDHAYKLSTILKHGEKDAHRLITIFNENLAVDQLYYQIGMEKPHFRKIINPEHLVTPFYVKPKMSNKRIAAQSGAFLIYPAHPERSEIFSDSKLTISMISFKIPAKAKKELRDDLQHLGIHGGSLFPGLDRSSAYIMESMK